ncbi:MAG: TetR/AcrR family transcriptional regulator [Acidiferrobacterales bacterium]
MDNATVTKRMPNETDTSEPLGRRARKALAVRQALFEAGLAAFERQPIGLVSILDITEAADVAKGVFYLQFRSKDDYLLALWEEVHGRFLDAARTAVIDCGDSTRLDMATREFVSFVHHAPAAARFWLRMSSYFPDEIGEPGHLTRIRQEYLQQLGALIVGKTVADLSANDVQIALVVDTLCWAVVGAEIQQGEPLVDAQTLVRTVRAAMPTLHRGVKRDNVKSLSDQK